MNKPQMMDERTRRLRRAWRTLKMMEETARAAGNSSWWRTHSQIIRSGAKGMGEIVALADNHDYLKRQGVVGYDINPLMEAPNSRHIEATNPKAISELIAILRQLFPELQGDLPGEPK